MHRPSSRPDASPPLRSRGGMARALRHMRAAGVALLAGPCAGVFAAEPLDCSRLPQAHERSGGGFYTGQFEGGPAFRMSLPAGAPPAPARDRRTPEPAAEYWYPRTYIGTALPMRADDKLPAAAARDGGFAFIVTDPDSDKPAERFEGRLSPDRAHASGTWTNLRNGKRLPFTLARLYDYRVLELSAPRPKSATEGEDAEDAARPYDFDAVWPVLPDAGATQALRSAVLRCGGPSGGALDESHEARIVWQGPDAVSVAIMDYEYEPGTPHGQPSSRGFAFAVHGGAWRLTRLADWLDTSPACLRQATQRTAALLRKQEAASPEQAKIDADAHFTPLPGGLWFTFDPYEVDSYAGGRHEVFVDKRELAHCVKALPAAD